MKIPDKSVLGADYPFAPRPLIEAGVDILANSECALDALYPIYDRCGDSLTPYEQERQDAIDPYLLDWITWFESNPATGARKANYVLADQPFSMDKESEEYRITCPAGVDGMIFAPDLITMYWEQRVKALDCQFYSHDLDWNIEGREWKEFGAHDWQKPGTIENYTWGVQHEKTVYSDTLKRDIVIPSAILTATFDATNSIYWHIYPAVVLQVMAENKPGSMSHAQFSKIFCMVMGFPEQDNYTPTWTDVDVSSSRTYVGRVKGVFDFLESIIVQYTVDNWRVRGETGRVPLPIVRTKKEYKQRVEFYKQLAKTDLVDPAQIVKELLTPQGHYNFPSE